MNIPQLSTGLLIIALIGFGFAAQHGYQKWVSIEDARDQ